MFNPKPIKNMDQFQLQLSPDSIERIALRVVELQNGLQQDTSRKPLLADEPPISISEACELLKISEPTLRKRRARGEIPCYRQGRNYYFFKSELLASLKDPKAVRRLSAGNGNREGRRLC